MTKRVPSVGESIKAILAHDPWDIPEAWVAERDAAGARLRAKTAYVRAFEWCVDDLHDAWKALHEWDDDGPARFAYEAAEDALWHETNERHELEREFAYLQGRIYDRMIEKGWD